MSATPRKVRFQDPNPLSFKATPNDGFFGPMELEGEPMAAHSRAHFNSQYGKFGTSLLTTGSLFDWSRNTFHETREGLSAYDYPFSKKNMDASSASPVVPVAQDAQDLKNLVQECLDLMYVGLGNIAPIIAADLSLPIDEKERELLPKFDSVHPYWDITDEAKHMLRMKIPRARVEHAQNLALENKIDILFTWKMPALAFETDAAHRISRIVYLTPRQHTTFNQAMDAMYKPFPLTKDEDVEFSEEGEPIETGGFYAVVPKRLHSELLGLVDKFRDKFVLEVVVEPKFLSAPQQVAISQYHASRKRASEELVAKRTAERAKAARDAEEEAYQSRKKDTYSAALKRTEDMTTDLKYDWRVGDAVSSERRNEDRWRKMTGGWWD